MSLKPPSEADRATNKKRTSKYEVTDSCLFYISDIIKHICPDGRNGANAPRPYGHRSGMHRK